MYVYTATHDFQISSHILTRRSHKKNLKKCEETVPLLNYSPSSRHRPQVYRNQEGILVRLTTIHRKSVEHN